MSADQRSQTAANDQLLRGGFTLLVIGIALGAFIAVKLWMDYAAGGNGWKQGDWLINSEAVDIRRGLMGLGILRLGDLLGLSPLPMIIILQGAALAALSYLLVQIMLRVGLEPNLWAMIFLPPFWLTFWSNDPQGSMRKELLVFLSMALIVASIGGRRLLYFLGALIAALAFFGHEANVMLMPAILYLLWIGRGKLPRSRAILILLAVISAGAAAAAYALAYPIVPDVAVVCESLLRRGAPLSLCDGAIGWLSVPSGEAMRRVASGISARALLQSLAVYGLSAIAWHILARRYLSNAYAWVIFFLPLVCVAPLYVVAVDHGRWMSIHFTVATFLIFAHYLSERPAPIRTSIPLVWVYALVFLGIFFSPRHTLGLSDGRAALFVAPALALLFIHRWWRASIARKTAAPLK